MECAEAIRELQANASLIIIVGLTAGIWAMVDLYFSGKEKPPKRPEATERGVVYCPLHRGDRMDCEDKH